MIAASILVGMYHDWTVMGVNVGIHQNFYLAIADK
jgi:hypothetical protein